MSTFLEKVARELVQNHPDLKGISVVLPSRRAAVFLKEELGKLITRPVWSPTITTIEDFLLDILELELHDQASLIFKLYESYCAEVSESRDNFKDFSHWAMLLLSDFNEIDRYLVDHKQLFSYLGDVERIKNWNVSPDEVSDALRSYFYMWDNLDAIYMRYTEDLKKEGSVYQGLAYRMAFEQIEDLIPSLRSKYSKMYFVGFNALNKAEEEILRRLRREGLAQFYWDVDSYYYEDQEQEAGKLLRSSKLINELVSAEQFQWLGDDLTKREKKINIVATAGDQQQAIAANRIISEMGAPDLKEVALVMADEQLLPLFLNNLSEKVDSLNVTMGLPLVETQVAGFFNVLLKMLTDHEKNGKVDDQGNACFHHQYWNDFFSSPLSRIWLDEPSWIPDIHETIIQRNYIFLSCEQISSWYPKALGGSITGFFQSASSSSISEVWGELALLAQELYLKADQRLDLPQPLYGFYKVFNRLAELMQEFPYVTDWQTAARFFNDLISSETLDLKGDPLQGLQVMGMLESRTLDFRKLIITSLNEGVLPKGRSENSLIPFDIRRQFGLPTYLDKDAVFAYHFYRILQRAEEITLIYNASSEGLNTGEPSRFIRQLELEVSKKNDKVRISELNRGFEVSRSPDERIWKSDSVREDLEAMALKGISPTALIDYINDQTEFYRKRILKLKEADEVEEIAGYDTQGNVVHQLLEEYYKPVLSNDQSHILSADLEVLLTSRETIQQQVESLLSGNGDQHSFDFGKNLIIREILIGMIHRFLKKERAELMDLEAGGKLLELKGLEESYEHTLELDGGRKVKIHGNIDRIDSVSGITRIIDYKTGAVEKSKLSVKDWEDLRQPKDGNKSLQLMVYAWLYMKNKPEIETLQAGIISLRDSSSWLMPLKYQKSPVLTRAIIEDFELFLKGLLEEIFDLGLAFQKIPVTLHSDA